MATPTQPHRIRISYDRYVVAENALNGRPHSMTFGNNVLVGPDWEHPANKIIDCANDQYGRNVDFNVLYEIREQYRTPSHRNDSVQQFRGWYLMFELPTDEEVEEYRNRVSRYVARFSHLIAPDHASDILISHNLHKHSIDKSLQNICDFQESAVKLANAMVSISWSPTMLDLFTPIAADMKAAKNKQCKVVMADLISNGVVSGLVPYCTIAHQITSHTSGQAFSITGSDDVLTFGDRMKSTVSTAVDAMFSGGEFNYQAGERLHDLLANRYSTTLPTSGELYVVAARLSNDVGYAPTSWQAALDELVTN